MIDGVTLVSGPTKFSIMPGAVTVYAGIVWSLGVTPTVGIYVDNVLITVE